MKHRLYINKDEKLIELEDTSDHAKRMGISIHALRSRRNRKTNTEEGIMIDHTFYYFKPEVKNGHS